MMEKGPCDLKVIKEEKSNQEIYTSGQNQEESDDCLRDTRSTGNNVDTNGGAQGNEDLKSGQERENETEQTLSRNATPVVSGVRTEVLVPLLHKNAFSNEGNILPSFATQQASSSESNNITTAVAAKEHRPLVNELHILEVCKKQDMQDFKKKLQELLNEMESKAKINFQEVLETVTCTAKSNLDQKVQAIQEATESELDRKAEALQKATQSKLDQKAEAMQSTTQLKLDQKRSEMEKSIESLFESETTKLKDTSSHCVEKIEVCTEGSLARLSRFTETWLANSCNQIANRLKPYLFVTSETKTPSRKDHNDVIGEVVDAQIRSKESPSDIKSIDSDRVTPKNSSSLDCSKENFPIGYQPSSIKGQVSLTQGSNSRGSQNSRDNKVLLQPLRRSKRTRQANTPKSANHIDKNQTPVAKRKHTKKSNDKEQELNNLPYQDKKDHVIKAESVLPLTITNNDKALCVTPTGVVSEPKHKSNNNKQAPRLHRRQIPEPDEPNILRSIPCRQKTPRMSPTKKRRLEADREVSRNHVPPEIVAYSNCQLSPLGDPKLVTSDKRTKRPRSDIGLKARRTRKSKAFSSTSRIKRRKGKQRTYTKRSSNFDVTEKDNFKF
uniref:Uncharacterized protein n=1 Tax=Pseudo-nitzschia australis TaxID=44445 RepID=A0A7S4ALG9_9STRA